MLRLSTKNSGSSSRPLAALILVTAIGLSTTVVGQWTLDQPGARQPVAPSAPRVPPLPEASWTDVQKQLVAKHVPNGRMDNAFKTLLTVPELFDGVMPYTNYLLNESSLTPRQRELLVLRAAWLLGNQALWATHAPIARNLGFTAAEIRRIAEGPDAAGWDPVEANLLRMADQLYRNSSVTNAIWDGLSAKFSLFNMLDAVETVNHFIVMGMLYNAYGVQPDADLKDRLPKDVTYRINVPAREPALKLARVEAPAGRGIAVGRTFGRYPALSQRWSPRQSFINARSKLTPRHREMLILRMGWNCRAEYEWAKHVGSVGRARDHGLDPPKIAEGPTASVWTPVESNILRLSDELYRDGVVSDKAWKSLSESFDTGWMMSAVFSTSAYRAISLSLNTYGVQLDTPEDERLPEIPAGAR